MKVNQHFRYEVRYISNMSYMSGTSSNSCQSLSSIILIIVLIVSLLPIQVYSPSNWVSTPSKWCSITLRQSLTPSNCCSTDLQLFNCCSFSIWLSVMDRESVVTTWEISRVVLWNSVICVHFVKKCSTNVRTWCNSPKTKFCVLRHGGVLLWHIQVEYFTLECET